MNWLLIIVSAVASIAVFIACVMVPAEKETENLDTADANKNDDFIYKAAVLVVGKTFYEDFKLYGANDFGEIVAVIIGDTLIIAIVFFVINKVMEVLNIFNKDAVSRREKAFMAAAVINLILTVINLRG